VPAGRVSPSISIAVDHEIVRQRQVLNRPEGAHAGHSLDALEQPIVEAQHVRDRPVVRTGRLHAQRQHARGTKAEVHEAQAPQGLEHQAGADDQHERQRRLGDDECAAQPARGWRRAGRRRAAQQAVEVGPRGHHRRRQGEQHA